jgi:hypothetical protein
MVKKLRTPVIRPRTQGGTFYTFGSALEDIGLNVNEGRNRVEMSHYILLNIPNFDKDRDGSIGNLHLRNNMDYSNNDLINQGDMMFAESFQDFVLNMETVVRNNAQYNFADPKTVSERVFWKWLFRDRPTSEFFTQDSSSGYYYENDRTSIAKAFGTISAGAQRTDDNGIYNETFVQIPSSYGYMRVYFKQVFDENYTIKRYTGTTQNTIEGFGDGSGLKTLSYCRFTWGTSDFPNVETAIRHSSSNKIFIVKSINRNNGYVYASIDDTTTDIGQSGTFSWNDGSNHSSSYTGFLLESSNSVISTTEISSTPIFDASSNGYCQYIVSNNENSLSDTFEAELDITKLRQIYGNPSLSYDDIGMGKYSESKYTSFSFNAILVYYSIYNSNKTKRLATNAYGVYILDNSIESDTDGVFFFPSLNKLQTTPLRQGTSYSFRINIKPTTAYSGDIHVEDNSTAAFEMSEDFNDVIRNLSSALTILRTNTQVLYTIKKKDDQIEDMVSKTMERIDEIEANVNGIINGNFPYTASGIYRKNPLEDTFGTLTPTMAKTLINAMTIRYTENGDMCISINTRNMTGDTLMIATALQKNMNNDTYFDMLTILQILVARLKTTSSNLITSETIMSGTAITESQQQYERH